MASKTVTVGSSVGLHARPASIIAEAAAEYDDEILLTLVGSDDDEETDASSSLMIMALGAEYGNEVTVTSDNAEAVEKIAALIAQDLDAE
ncbi:phosphocarrier protein HPr [Corynebacterium glutamicum]|uniref:HPr family phosphocarrier protein n=1 Tax=Corynebacterium glutamicum TaxID=1718 RepID=UPI00097B1B33|nr:HPr family phosphocarrier protein [Corynebacterium glutamicum]GAV97466.1 phosphocarrier protein HPr [Corynebacterium glutamicum]